jgi:hypothetical protein
MALKGLRTSTRWLVSTVIGSVTVAASLALAAQPAANWLSGSSEEATRVDAVQSTQSQRFVQTGAKGDGLTPVSTEVRAVPRAEQSAPIRGAGSIRADITRYNEERSVPRPQGRPADDTRAPSNANYRN